MLPARKVKNRFRFDSERDKQLRQTVPLYLRTHCRAFDLWISSLCGPESHPGTRDSLPRAEAPFLFDSLPCPAACSKGNMLRDEAGNAARPEHLYPWSSLRQ